jgi:FLYWCH zinc finger domain
MAKIKFVKSKRGANQLYFEGFCYNKDKETELKTTYRCVNYQKSKTNCKARIHLDVNGEIIEESSNPSHNHPGQAAAVESRAIVQKIKKTALKNPHLNPKAIISEEAQEIPDALTAELPYVRSITRQIRKARQTARTEPEIPQILSEFIVPEKFRRLKNGQKFLLQDTGTEDENRIVIFGTDKGVIKLKNYNEWYADGCFKVTIGCLFKQMYVIHAKRKHGIYPGVYVLLMNKKQETYSKMLDLVRRITSKHDYEINKNSSFNSFRNSNMA